MARYWITSEHTIWIDDPEASEITRVASYSNEREAKAHMARMRRKPLPPTPLETAIADKGRPEKKK